MIGSDAQQSDSAIRIRVSILLPIPLSSRLPYYIEQTYMCYTVVLCWLPIFFFMTYRNNFIFSNFFIFIFNINLFILIGG